MDVHSRVFQGLDGGRAGGDSAKTSEVRSLAAKGLARERGMGVKVVEWGDGRLRMMLQMFPRPRWRVWSRAGVKSVRVR